MDKLTYDVLYDLYVNQKLPMYKMAEILNCAVGSIYNYMKKYHIKSRTTKECFAVLKENGWEFPKEAAQRIGDKKRGIPMKEETKQKLSDAHFKGGIGHKKKRGDGYIAIYFPDHPKSSAEGYIMEHILVMEAIIGRHLNDDEVVHHINEIKDDNRACNL